VAAAHRAGWLGGHGERLHLGTALGAALILLGNLAMLSRRKAMPVADIS
jgi:hypothetical protein